MLVLSGKGVRPALERLNQRARVYTIIRLRCGARGGQGECATPKCQPNHGGEEICEGARCNEPSRVASRVASSIANCKRS